MSWQSFAILRLMETLLFSQSVSADMRTFLSVLDSKQTLSVARLQYIHVLSDEAARAFTTGYIKHMSKDSNVGKSFSFVNKSVVEKVFSTILAQELFKAYSYDLQKKSGKNKDHDYIYLDEMMKGKPVMNKTVSSVWDYMHPDLRSANGNAVIQEMVVMDKLAYFYSQYFVEFAFFDSGRKCLPFITFLSIKARNKDLSAEHCKFDSKGSFVLNEKRWLPNTNRSDTITDQERGDAFVNKLGLRYTVFDTCNSMPRTFQDCMEAMLYQQKRNKKKNQDSEKQYWWDFFDLTNFASLFDTQAEDIITSR